MISSGITRSLLALVAGWCLSFEVLAYKEADLEKLKTTGSCERCDLSGADLYEMDLFKANLSGANLAGADLTLADLTLANLTRGADLTGAVFDETNLSGANLRYATVDDDALDEAVFDSDRTRTKLGFKDLKLGMNIVEIIQYCSLKDHNIASQRVLYGIDPASGIKQVEATCYGEDDKAFTFKFSGSGTTGVLSFLEVDLVAYTVEDQRRLIDLLAKKYTLESVYTPEDLNTFNRDRSKQLHVIFQGGQVVLSTVGRGTGLRLVLTYRNEDKGHRFLARQGSRVAPDSASLPPVGIDLYPFVGNYHLSGIANKGVKANSRKIERAYLELDAVGHQLAGELTFEWAKGNQTRFRIDKIESLSEDSLTVRFELIRRGPRENWNKNSASYLRISFPQPDSGEIRIAGQWSNGANLKAPVKDDFAGQRTRTLWQLAVEKNTSDMYGAYLRMDPNGLYASLARSRLVALGEPLPTPVVEAPAKVVQLKSQVDPLVGVWVQEATHQKAWLGKTEDTCYLSIGKGANDELIAASWLGIEYNHQVRSHLSIGTPEARQDELKGIFRSRPLELRVQARNEYVWESLRELPGFIAIPRVYNPEAKKGRIWVKGTGEASTLSSNKPICSLVSLLNTHKFRRLHADEVALLELPGWYTQAIESGDMPSPLVDSETTVADSSSESAAPVSEPAEAVDPLVGIWRIEVGKGAMYAPGGACYLLVGQRNDRTLAGISWEDFPDRMISNLTTFYSFFNYKEVPPRTLSIGKREGRNYTWHTEDIGHYSGDQIAFLLTADNGVITLAEGSDAPFHLETDRDFCRNKYTTSSSLTNVFFDKLSLSESAALKLPPEVEQKIKDGTFPTPFHSGVQWAGQPSMQPATAATTASAAPVSEPAEAVDPLVGVWRIDVPEVSPGGACYLLVGQRDNGTLVGTTWEDFPDEMISYLTTFKNWFTYKEVPPRTLSIGVSERRSYTWRTEDIGHYPGDQHIFFATADNGVITLAEGSDAFFHFQTDNDFCRSRFIDTRGHREKFYKLLFNEIAELKLPPELEQKIKDGTFPTPFHPGTQWAGQPSTTAGATTASAAPVSEPVKAVDPLVGIWRVKVGHTSDAACYLLVGQSDNGTLVGTSWEDFPRALKKLVESYFEWFTFKDVPPRTLSIGVGERRGYTWHTEDIGHHSGDNVVFFPTANNGMITLAEGSDAPFHLKTDKDFCRSRWSIAAPPTNEYFDKLSLSEIAALKLPPELEQKIKDGSFPTPFRPDVQWAAEPATTAGATTASAAPVSEPVKAVDPLVGIWLEELPPAPEFLQGPQYTGLVDRCYFALGQDSAGLVSGAGWLTELNNKSRFRESRSLSIQPGTNDDRGNTWRVETEIQKVDYAKYSVWNFVWEHYTTPAAGQGQVAISQEEGESILRSTTPVCTISSTHRGDHVFRRLSLKEVAVLEFPAWYQEAIETGNMPSPIVDPEASVAGASSKIPQTTDNEPQEFRDSGR